MDVSSSDFSMYPVPGYSDTGMYPVSVPTRVCIL